MSAPDSAPRQRPRPFEPWEHDNAHAALDQWIYSWRQTRQDERLPGNDFAKHLGREAVELMDSGMAKVELARLFWECGEEGCCPCGNRWDERVPVPLAEAS